MNCRILLALLLGLVLAIQSTSGQKKKLLVQDLLKEIEQTKGDTFSLSNVKISTNEESGFHYVHWAVITHLPKSIRASLDTIHINKVLIFNNVDFEDEFNFRLFRFHQRVEWKNINHSNLSFFYCKWDSTFALQSNSEKSYINLHYCWLLGDLDISDAKIFSAIECHFLNQNHFFGDIGMFEIKRCTFQMLHGPNSWWGQPFNLDFRGLTYKKKTALELFDCQFLATGKEMGVDFFYNQFLYFNIQNCQFEVPVMFYLTQMDRMVVENTRFKKPIDFREVGINVASTNMPFSQISGMIAVKDTFYSEYEPNTILYQGKTNAELRRQGPFNQLIAVYSKLLGVYKYRGDQDSYNACYIEMKDITSRKAAFDYRQNPSIESLFEWRLAQFLKTFCDYGTNPVKSLIFSFYLIMAFAGIYFLFPSEEDNLSRNRFSKFLTGAVDYFKTDKQLLDFQVEGQESELQNLKFLKEKLEEARFGTPGIISWIGWPFYGWMSVYNKFMIWMYNRTDLVKGKWSLLSPIRKFWLTFLVVIYFLLFLFSGLIIRILNALALSLNVFVTLGYGEISASGSMRYFAVLEGLLGWFLLSIFSVSLIGQVLQ